MKNYAKSGGKKMKNKINIDPSDDEFGVILNSAVRYSMGRRTYMPMLVIDYITPLLPYLSDRCLWCFESDIESNKNIPNGYGDDNIDKPRWMKFLSDVQNELSKRKERNNE
jgi:hypothetical protein